jgi:hypothetical protein
MSPRSDVQPTPGHPATRPRRAPGWRAGLALGWRWALRAVAGYAAFFALLIAGSLLVQPSDDWSAVGGFGRFLMDFLALLLFMSPVLAAIGVALAIAIWIALRASRGSAQAGAITAGVAATGLSMAHVLVYSDPLLPDVLGYLALSAGIGVVAAWTTTRDIARVPSLTDWLARLRLSRRADASSAMRTTSPDPSPLPPPTG